MVRIVYGVKQAQLTSNKKAVLSQARKPRDAAAVIFCLRFADNIHCKFKSSHASKARFCGSKQIETIHITGAKRNLTQNGHAHSGHVFWRGD